MNILVCGGRNFNNKNIVFKVLDDLPFQVTRVINGGAKGADALSTQWARERKIRHKEYHANWSKDGRAAGPIRNSRMLEEEFVNMVIAFPGEKGTADMISKAKKKGIKVLKVKLTKPNKL